MTNDTFLGDEYENDLRNPHGSQAHNQNQDPLGLNDGLDDLELGDSCYNSEPDDDDDDDDDDGDYNPSWGRPPSGYGSPYGSYHGPYNNPYGSYGKKPEEPSITKDLLTALLASHAREVALLKKINKDLTSPKQKYI